MTRLLLAQRNAPPEQTEFQRVAAKRRTCKLDLGALNEPQRHQTLHLGIGGVYSLDLHLLALSQRCERIAVHYVNTNCLRGYALIPQMIMIRITRSNRQFY